MQNIVFKDVFTDEEIASIKQTIKDNSHLKLVGKTIHQIDRGRDDLYLNYIIDPKILDKIQNYLNTLGDYELGPVTWIEYNNKITNPNLPPHKDPKNVKLTFDYQLESNVDWPIVIDDIEYQLKDNEAIAFDSRSQWHWRPEKIFKDGDYMQLIFFYINDPDVVLE